LRELGLGPESTLVDLGTGTGALALAAAPMCRRVVAVDVSPAMLAYVQRQATEQHAANLELVQAGFLSYEHSGAPADFIYTRHALHQIPDFWKAIALQRMAAILKPHGILRLRDLFLSCALDETHAVIETWLARAAPSSDVGWTRAEYETHLRDEFSTFTWLFEPMLAQAGFEILEATYSDSRIYTEYTCRRP